MNISTMNRGIYEINSVQVVSIKMLVCAKEDDQQQGPQDTQQYSHHGSSLQLL